MGIFIFWNYFPVTETKKWRVSRLNFTSILLVHGIWNLILQSRLKALRDHIVTNNHPRHVGALTDRLASRYSATGQTNRRNASLDGFALNGRSKTALNFAVVRSSHSRPAPFRCRFQNARSVRLNDSTLCAKIWQTRYTTDAKDSAGGFTRFV